MNFEVTAVNVLLLVAMAIPGYILIKVKAVKQTAIAPFAKVLLYVNQPFLTLNSFLRVSYQPSLLKNLGISVAFSFGAQLVLLLILCLIYRRWYNKKMPKKTEGFLQTNVDSFRAVPEAQVMKGKAMRVLTTCSVFGNVGFLGIPILNVLLPEMHEAVAYAAVFIVAMNFLCWTVGAYVLTGDRKYISVKKAFLNPPTITLVVALPLFFLNVQLPEPAMNLVNLLAQMTTPLCMIILGMRFASAPLKELFIHPGVYVASLTKILIFPLLTYAAVYFLPIDYSVKVTLFILSAMPSASVNLNLSEIYGGDSKTAANTILLSTLLCVVTIPLLLLMA